MILGNCFFYLQAFIPNEVKLFGSAHQYLTRSSSICGFFIFHFNIRITRTHVTALDQPSQRCASQTEIPETTTCIASFIEREIGCSPNILGSRYPKGVPCDKKAHLHALANISKVFQTANDNEIYQITGCLSACKKDQYTLQVDPIEKILNDHGRDCEFKIRFKIMDRTYKEEEQYVIYDTDSFFADVGGFMGLLLGSSLLSLYNVIEALLKKVLCRPTKGRQVKIC